MQVNSSETVEAVIFIEGDKVVRELLYPEFEALLDGYAPLHVFAGKTAKAVYLMINSSLQATSAVFFVVAFDDKGYADSRWNIPLRPLVEASGMGPDLGAGPIRLACFSQCGIEIQRNNLWDPRMESGKNSFSLIKKTLKANRLGLTFKKPKSTAVKVERRKSTVDSEANERQQLAMQQTLREEYAQELRDRLAAELKDQRLRISTLQSSHQEQIKNILNEHQQRLRIYQEHLKALEEKKSDLMERNATLKENLDIQARKVEGIREYFTHKLKRNQIDEESQAQTMQENISIEVELKVQAATREMREALDMRDMQLFYRHQNETSLKNEIAHLKQQNQDLLNTSGEQLLTQLNKAGVSFVVFHPGVGQFAVALADLSRYLSNPTLFAAQKAGVDEALYNSWFRHYQKPICTETSIEGSICEKSIPKVESPLEFHIGESDRCEKHKSISFGLMSDIH